VRRLLLHAALVTGVALGARALAYALAPGPEAARLAGQAGGPRLPAVAAVALATTLAAAAAMLFFTRLAVRERLRLDERAGSLPPIRPRSIALRALAFFAVAAPACALLESYVHWRAGLGWHGLTCLRGPVHQELIPLVAALSLLAATAVAAADQLVAGFRRVVAAFLPTLSLSLRRTTLTTAPSSRPPARRAPLVASARGPPLRC
jgi:hypothetical protein